MVGKNPKFDKYGYVIAVTGGAVIITIVLVILGVRPLYASLNKTNNELKEKKAVLEKLESNLTNLQNLNSRKEEIKERNEKVLSALPADKDLPRLFIQMEKIAAGAGFQIASVSEGSATGGASGTGSAETATTNVQGVPTINPLFYTVTGTARSYANLKQALDKIEEGLRLISIEKVDVSNNQSGNSLAVTLTVKTYSRGGAE